MAVDGMPERCESITFKTGARVFVVAWLIFAGPASAVELMCGACKDNCRAKRAKHWNEKRLHKYYDLWAERETAECGGCCNGELVKAPSQNGT